MGSRIPQGHLTRIEEGAAVDAKAIHHDARDACLADSDRGVRRHRGEQAPTLVLSRWIVVVALGVPEPTGTSSAGPTIWAPRPLALPTAPVRPWALPWRSGRAEPFTMDPLSHIHGSVGVAVPAVQLLSAAALKRL